VANGNVPTRLHAGGADPGEAALGRAASTAAPALHQHRRRKLAQELLRQLPIALRLRHREQQGERHGPGLVDLLAPDDLVVVAVAEMEADETEQLVVVAGS
jgi:hypothetical protein